MTTSFTIPIYQRKEARSVHLTTLGLGAATLSRAGANAHKVEEHLLADLRRTIEEAAPRDLPAFELKRGTRLERVRIEATLRDGPSRRKIAGLAPLVIEPRDAGDGATIHVAYHPARQAEWFPVKVHAGVAEQASAFFAEKWASLTDSDVEDMWTNLRDSIKVVSLSVRTRSLLDELPERARGPWDDLDVDPVRGAKKKKKKSQGMKVLPKLAVDLTARAANEAPESLGMPRSPHREHLQTLLSGARKQSTILVGRPGSGKTTLLRRLVADMLVSDDYESHRNLDRVAHVWRIGGKQIIAGMSYVGDWEQRCVDILEDVRDRRVVLLASDLHLFGQIGRARDSDRSLADFFRGPVSRGQLVMAGECTPEQLRRLQEDAPSFASLFSVVHVGPASVPETFRMMLDRTRALERDRSVIVLPEVFKTILELGSALFPNEELPGKALDLLERVVAEVATEGVPADSDDVLEHISLRTGLPWVLLQREKPLTLDEVEEELRSKVMGQPAAVREAASLVLRIKAGLTDPGRPYGVYLFTGPTGTGKTELAKALAEYLYGSATRLVRFDMSELSGPEAPSRLIGDAWEPDGLLTRAGIEQPFSVVLLDEIEKAHPSVLNLLLQLFDEGRLTDAAGNTASFTQSVVVMTSNLGARTQAPAGFAEAPGGLMLDVARAVRDFFPPELFNRIDAVVPFTPLSSEVAVEVAQKELSKLFARQGLTERNIFVQSSRAVVERVAGNAFRAQDGARSLKRYIEDRIASLLAEEIAKSPAATLQVMRVVTKDDGFAVHHERLVEAEPAAVRYDLERLWSAPLARLREGLPVAIADVERIESSPALARLAEQLRHHLGEHNRGVVEHGERLYNVEWLRVTVQKLRERLEGLVVESRDLEHDAIERRLTDPELRGKAAQLVASRTRWQCFSAIAETHALERALARVEDPTQHAALIEIVPIGAQRTLMAWLVHAYARGRGRVDEFAFLAKGEVHEGKLASQLGPAYGAAVEVVVLKMVGLCVTDFFELETGTHAWHPLAREPELVRVRVVPARHGDTARSMVDAFAAAKSAADASGDPEASPTKLLPLVRSVRFEPPAARKPATLLELEDYRLGLSERWRVRSLTQALDAVWLFRLSRVEAAATPAPTDGGAS